MIDIGKYMYFSFTVISNHQSAMSYPLKVIVVVDSIDRPASSVTAFNQVKSPKHLQKNDFLDFCKQFGAHGRKP